MNLGTVILTTNRNHLDTYIDEKDEFAIPVDKGILTCKVEYDIYNNILDNKSMISSLDVSIASARLLNYWNYESHHDFIVITPDGIEKIDGAIHTPYHYKPAKIPVLGCCCVSGFVVTVTHTSYTICKLGSMTQQTRHIKEIKRCTAISAGWQNTLISNDTSMDLLHVFICDGNNVNHYIGEEATVIDTGRVLAFCQTEFGFLAAFETNWRLSPLHLFGDGPINLENLELPTKANTLSNEARLQLYDWQMIPIDDKSLPSHNEPTLLVHKHNVVCVSGFYKHVISVFFLKNNSISHLKDISIGLEFRIAGLNFRQNDLLVLKRRLDSDNILLTFPSKSGSITGNAFINVVKLEEHIGNIMGSKKKQNYGNKDKYSLKNKDANSILLPRYIDHNNITEEEIKRRAAELIDEYSEKPPSIGSFSDSELSEGTLEILADCRPRHPFIPIPVSDSSSEELNELRMPGKLIIPHTKGPANKFNLISEVSYGNIHSDESSSKGLANISNLVNDISSIKNHSDETFSKHVDSVESCNCCDTITKKESDLSNISEKLDRVVNLMERQNSLLEMIARQSLLNK